MTTPLQNLQAAFNLSQDMVDLVKEGHTIIAAFQGKGGTIDHIRTGFKASLSGFVAVSTSSNLQAIKNWLYQVQTKASAAGLKRGD
jgi:hypothetical protein